MLCTSPTFSTRKSDTAVCTIVSCSSPGDVRLKPGLASWLCDCDRADWLIFLFVFYLGVFSLLFSVVNVCVLTSCRRGTCDAATPSANGR